MDKSERGVAPDQVVEQGRKKLVRVNFWFFAAALVLIGITLVWYEQIKLKEIDTMSQTIVTNVKGRTLPLLTVAQKLELLKNTPTVPSLTIRQKLYILANAPATVPLTRAQKLNLLKEAP
jgi:hypothetical protein